MCVTRRKYSPKEFFIKIMRNTHKDMRKYFLLGKIFAVLCKEISDHKI